MNIIINGKSCECEKGEFLLTVAERNGFKIPTLCHHQGVAEQGCCRVCLVEVIENKKSKIVVSCVYPIERECEVLTDSDRVKKNRAVVLMLLKMRAPDSPEIAALCKEYNAVDGSRFKPLDDEKCVMCGLCARACKSLGTGAISTVSRGIEKKVSTPYDEPSMTCMGCLSCAKVCPTNAIAYEEDDKTRKIWHRSFNLVRCKSCNAIIGTDIELIQAASRSKEEDITLCADCRKKQMTDVMAFTYGIDTKDFS